jgi:tRNA threonylcarbamoyladenosine biosynthesis protein TsaE
LHHAHPAILESRQHHWPDEAACAADAQVLAARPGVRRAVIELHGTLGAGKTTFTRHLLQALGVTGRIKSPTYAVMESYTLPDLGHADGSLPISHFDFYRFNDPQEFEDAGFRDVYAQPGLKLAEWPEKAAGLLPVPDLRITLSLVAGADADAEDGRSVLWEALTPAGRDLLP